MRPCLEPKGLPVNLCPMTACSPPSACRLVLNKQLLATICITNPLDTRVAFKIKTTAPKKYVVRPSSGIAEPRSQVNVQVIMQAQKEYPPDFQNCRDKFMIQVTSLAEGETLDKDTFNKETRRDMQEHRLRVIMESPAAPPSPVPEANEGDAEGGDASHRVPAGENAAAAASNAPSLSAQDALKMQLERVKREREDLRKKLVREEDRQEEAHAHVLKRPFKRIAGHCREGMLKKEREEVGETTVWGPPPACSQSVQG